jgi:hypothetical protein
MDNLFVDEGDFVSIRYIYVYIYIYIYIYIWRKEGEVEGEGSEVKEECGGRKWRKEVKLK